MDTNINCYKHFGKTHKNCIISLKNLHMFQKCCNFALQNCLDYEKYPIIHKDLGV